MRKRLVTSGNAWKHLQAHVYAWESLGARGDFLKRAEIDGDRRPIVESTGGMLKQVEARGSAWTLEESYENSQKREGTRETGENSL